LLLPLRAGHSACFILQVDGGGQPTPGDPRILNFCVWDCCWSPAWGEFAPDASGTGPFNFKTDDEDRLPVPESVTLRDGWYNVEEASGKVFRWAAPGAGLVLQVPDGPAAALNLEIEPGPAVGSQPFLLEVHNRAGQAVARGWVKGRQYIALQL